MLAQNGGILTQNGVHSRLVFLMIESLANPLSGWTVISASLTAIAGNAGVGRT
jgi:hypothetical protein